MAPQLEGIGLPKPDPLSGLTVVLEMFLVFVWRLQNAMIIRHHQKVLSVRSCLLLNHVLQLLYLSSAMLITNQCLFTYSCWISRSLLEMDCLKFWPTTLLYSSMVLFADICRRLYSLAQLLGYAFV